MDAKTRDCLVTSYHSLIASLKLRGPEDRLAAAIAGRCEVIVTQKIGDFPEGTHAPCSTGRFALQPF
jgi:hypothetical protein